VDKAAKVLVFGAAGTPANQSWALFLTGTRKTKKETLMVSIA
jgi:hypothetical protein